jgi:DNA processing protein
VTSRASAGANELLHAGAAVIRGPRDVLELVLGADAPRLPEPEPPLPPLDPVQRRLLEAIERGRGTLAELATTMEEARTASRALSQLELLGLIRRGFGGRYVRCS